MKFDNKTALGVVEELAWLKGLSPRLPALLIKEGALVHLDAGQWSQAEDEIEAGITIVIEGLLDLFAQARNGQIIQFRQIGPGAAIGYALATAPLPRLLTAVCAEPSLLLRLSDVAAFRIAAAEPDFWQAVVSFQHLNTRDTIRMVTDHVSLSVQQRLAVLLVYLARIHHKRGRIVIRQQQLAEMLGVTRKTVNLCLAAFQKSDWVAVDKNAVEVKNLRSLHGLIKP